ncbi:hypothetical protein [Parvularcula sp. LCG005]|uniref:hypothetical protein n=1 Tax=Parvularcula sp. LCG005 TaxID=3078805 RepID=UPI0029439E20|nr:hypothetical protein [Parvularcula sp. LCG005]WOI54652.1 hypothetical protein RUI03_06535 [Parvularcula sp. LCG005]
MTTTTNNEHVQAPLPFATGPVVLTYCPAPANADALAVLHNWLDDWRSGQNRSPLIAVRASAGCGKTRLAHKVMAELGGVVVAPNNDDGSVAIPKEGPFAVDNADRATGHALISVYNAASSSGRPCLLTGTAPRDRWGIGPGGELPDLKTRLRSFAVLELESPDEATLALVLKRTLDEAGIKVADKVVADVAAQLKRRYSAVELIATAAVRRAMDGSMSAKALLQSVMRDNPGAIL